MNIELLKDKIKEKGLSQKACGKAIDVAPNTFRKVLEGKRDLTTEEVKALIEVLGIKNNNEKVAIFFG